MVLEAVAIKVLCAVIARGIAASGGTGRPVDLDRVVKRTSERFEEVPGVEPTLEEWIASAGFAELPGRLISGEREFGLHNLVEAYIADGGFYMPDDGETLRLARAILEEFLGVLVSEIYSSDQSISALANRQEELHLGTLSDIKRHVTAEVEAIRTDVFRLAAQASIPETPWGSEPAMDPEHLKLTTQLDGVRELINTGLVRTARRQLDELLDSSEMPDGLAFRVTTYLGLCALVESDYERACELFDDAHLIQPDEPQGIANQAVGASLQEDFRRAEKFARKALEMDPNNGKAAAALIHALWKLEKSEQLDQLMLAKSWIIEDDQAGLALAQVRVSESRGIEAISICQHLIDNDPENFTAALLLGQTLLNEAQAKFSRSGGSDVESYPMLVRAEAEARRAIRLLKNTQRDSLRADAHALRALVLGALGRTEDAAREAERALEDAPHHHAAMLCRGLTLLQARKPREAIEAWKDLGADEFPDGFEVFLADAHLGAGESTEARDILRGKLDFEHPGLHLLERVELLARADSHDGLTSDIWRDLEVATAQHPEDSYLLTASAIRSRVRGDDEHAAQLLERALDSVADTDRWTIQLRLAEVHMSTERYSEAADALAEVVGEVARHPLAERLLVCLVNGGRYREALDWCQQMRGALSDCPKAVIDAEAQLLERAGDLATTRTLREQLCQRSDATARDYFRLALVQFRSGDQDAARLSVRQIDSGALEDDPFALLKVAQMKMMLGASGHLEDAYRAWQVGRQDPDIQLGYLHMHVTCEDELESPELAAPGCCVLLRNDEGEEWWRILEEGEKEWGDRNVAPGSLLAEKLVGCKSGDPVVTRNDIEQRSYEVVEVQTKFTRAFQETVQEFSTRFPDNRSLSRIEFNEDDLSPILELVDERSSSAQALVKEYSEERQMPFTLLCAHFGASELSVWHDCANNRGMPIRFGSGSPEEEETSAQLLKRADGVAVDVVALLTLHELGIIEELRTRFGNVIVPQCVMDRVREDCVAADKDRVAGHLGARGAGMYQFVEASEESRRKWREFVNGLWVLVDSCLPATSYGVLDVGEWDESQAPRHVALGTLLADFDHHGQHIVFVCDDFGLANFARAMGTGAVNSQSVLRELERSGVISESQYSQLVERLVLMNYTFVQVTSSDIVRRLWANGYQTTDGTRAMLRTLRGPECSDKAAVSVAAATVAEVAQGLSARNLTLFVALVMSALRAGREFIDIWKPFRDFLAQHRGLSLVPPKRSAVLSIVDDYIIARHLQLKPR